MAGSPGFLKRQKEQARQEKQKEKRLAREQKKAAPKSASADGEDPDLAGIVAGPQPTPEWMLDGSEAPPADPADDEK